MLLCAVLGLGCLGAAPRAAAEGRATSEILIRDPFVLVHEGKYYMYGTGLAWPGYGCVVSEDLETWSDSYRVFVPGDDFDGEGDYWAPECHYYNGSFYLFATYRSRETGFRGTAVFVASDPLGPFELLSDGHVTPKTRDCIDGTLYIDKKGAPWIVYVGEWTSDPNGLGTMCAAPLSEDLSEMTGEPITLFGGNETKWALGQITDGPFLYRTRSGRLVMLWSNYSTSGYCVGLAYSTDGEIDGEWKQFRDTLYEKKSGREYDGGHGMIFNDLDGNLLMSIHAPNTSTEDVFESAMFVPVTDIGFKLVAGDLGFASKLAEIFAPLLIVMSKAIEAIRAAF